MKAELDIIDGLPVLRLENSNGVGKRAVYDLQLTAQQARAVAIHTEVAR